MILKLGSNASQTALILNYELRFLFKNSFLATKARLSWDCR